MLPRITVATLMALKRIETVFALMYGVCFSLALYSFVLIDLLPLTGIRILLLTGLAFLIGTSGGFFLILWFRSQIGVFSFRQRWIILAINLLLSILLFFAGTQSWHQPHRYPAFLLPYQDITLQVQTDLSQPNSSLSLRWMTTALGEISYNAINHLGWQREGDELHLEDARENLLDWHGKSGDTLQFVFQSTQPGVARITVNGALQEIPLINTGADEQTITIPVSVPFYATRTAAQIYAFITLFVLSLALIFVLARRKTDVDDLFQRSLARFSLQRTQPVSHQPIPMNKREIWAVLGIVVAALLLRIFFLENLFPYTDEYSHLIAAKKILQGAPILSVYRRGLFIVTLPVTLFFKIFGMTFWAARLPGVIINALAIWPLYLTARKMNRPIAVIASILYATSPWVIAVARDVREYAYYPFYFFWVIYAMLIVLQNLPNGIMLDRHIWKQLHARWLIPLSLLVLPVLFALTIDSLSTFKVIFISYAIFAMFLLAKLDWESKANRLPIGALLLVMTLGGLMFLDRMHFIEFDLDMSVSPLNLFFPSPGQQWYRDRWNIFALFAVFFAVITAIRQRQHNMVPLFFVSMVTSYLIFFVFFFSRYFKPRYVFSVQFWYILVLAIGIYLIWLVVKLWIPHKSIQLGVVALILVASYNPVQTLQPTFYAEQKFHPISVEYHYDLRTVNAYIQENMQPWDALISTVYGNYVNFMGEPVFPAMMAYNHANPSSLSIVEQFMEKNPSGWIVIDINRYKDSVRPLPLESFFIGRTQVRYVDTLGDELVWRWETPDQ